MQGLKNYIIPFNVKEKESQYWLGYICADGNIQYSKKHRVYKVALFSKDKEIIDKFMLFMGSRCHYHLRKQNGIHEAYINSKQLCEYLNGSNNLKFYSDSGVELIEEDIKQKFNIRIQNISKNISENEIEPLL